MKKYLALGLILSLLIANTAFAFNYDGSLEDQIETMTDVHLNSEGELVLSGAVFDLKNIYVSPDHRDDNLTYLSTASGVFVNRVFNANYSKKTTMPQEFQNGPVDFVFHDDYENNGYVLAHTTDKLFKSYNYGSSWSEVNISEITDLYDEIMLVDFGPKFDVTNDLYLILDDGLYRKDISSTGIILVVENDVEGDVTDFDYLESVNKDNEYYIVKNDRVYKTTNNGDSWFDYDFNSPIKEFEVLEDGTSNGDLVVITEDNEFYFADFELNFFDLDLPAGVTEINGFEYYTEEDNEVDVWVIQTNLGFYVSYSKGDSWNFLDYFGLNPDHVRDFKLTKSGTEYALYVIYSNELWRDMGLDEELSLYMDGVESDGGYAAEGIAESGNIYELATDSFPDNYRVTSAQVFVDNLQLNGGQVNFEMTANGQSWVPVENGVTVEFDFPGTDLRWRATLITTDPSKTPVIPTLEVNYGVDEMINCAGFSDIPADSMYCMAYEFVKDEGIFTGYPDGTFQPENPINRAEIVKVITEGFDYTILEDDGTDLGFSDVGLGEWYMGYLKTAFEGGIIQGYPDGTYGPLNTVNYAELAKIFLATAEVEVGDPAEGEEWYQPYLDFMNDNNIFTADPDTLMTRQDVVILFFNWDTYLKASA